MSQFFTALSAALAFGLCSLSVQAQPHGPAPQHPPMPARPAPAGQYVLEGQVQQMLINPYGEVDGLRLKDGSIVKFPPHMAEALLAAVKVGDAVRAIGRAQTRGTVQAEAIIQTATGRTVYEQPPLVGEGRALPPHLRAQRLQTQQVEGRVDAVLTGPRGEANGVILGDGSIVRFPPESLRLSIQPGAAFAAAGMGTRNEFGTSLEAVSMGASLAALQPLYDRAP
ncbi:MULTISPECIES: hypothetical protein [Comamonas]|uniref:hypothetical protein n=1 Tax=Comamonas TaxID=283 RepID=UPI0025F6BBC6|nr:MULTISPECIES: hypothetical protein [Comamonas]MDR3067655.1 hypothetical protein [Comamonas sp.]MEB5966984.1 hypothetical protein [Comamonas testosteroni]